MLDIEDLVHHVCLMRPAELVVTYHAGPKPPSENQGYAGVFRADEAMDEIYAKAEPPTHDAWHPQSLDRPESTFVQTTFRRICRGAGRSPRLGGVARAGASNVALGAASSLFSGLVGGAWGIGGDTAYYSKPGSTATRVPSPGDAEESTAQRSPLALVRARSAVRRSGHARRVPLGATVFDTAAEALTDRPVVQEHDAPRRRPRVQYVGDPYYDDRGDASLLIQEFRSARARATASPDRSRRHAPRLRRARDGPAHRSEHARSSSVGRTTTGRAVRHGGLRHRGR